MKSRLIVNPVSGTDAAPDYLQTINERLRESLGEMDIVMTVAAGDASASAAQAARDGYERLFVGGGDGTLNEVINGVASVEGGLGRITFGLIPLGTGNDFAGALGIPEDVDAAINVLLEDRVLEVDVGMLNDRHFVNVSAGGFIAEVSDAVNPQLKTVAGKLAYLIGGAQVLMEYEHAGLRLRVIENERVVEREMGMEMFAVCNSRLVGGGRLIAPQAIINDGLLDVCIVEAMPTLDFINLLSSVSGGTHVEDPRVAYFRAREIDLHFDRTIKVNTDGEVLDAADCSYRILPRAARFLAGDAPYASQ
ncbi:MAG TPA: diacylglycerol kinase family protein [Pyrinomonadaceae bacterium]|nr:diacylglycerol kinase family protein [Pyrinomonadaceae bacterium]